MTRPLYLNKDRIYSVYNLPLQLDKIVSAFNAFKIKLKLSLAHRRI